MRPQTRVAEVWECELCNRRHRTEYESDQIRCRLPAGWGRVHLTGSTPEEAGFHRMPKDPPEWRWGVCDICFTAVVETVKTLGGEIER